MGTPSHAPPSCSPCRMLCCGLLMLVLSWASMAVDTAAAVVSGAGGEGRAGQGCAEHRGHQGHPSVPTGHQ